jgi:hypothetical protein
MEGGGYLEVRKSKVKRNSKEQSEVSVIGELKIPVEDPVVLSLLNMPFIVFRSNKSPPQDYSVLATAINSSPGENVALLYP